MSIIRIIDFETTGFAPPAEVIESAICDLVTSTGPWEVREPSSQLWGVQSISAETRAIHHIRAEDVAGLPPFDAAALATNSVDAVAAHNWAFEVQWLPDPGAPAICTYKAALRIWPDAPSHSNGALRYWLEDQGLITLDHDKTQPSHRAGPDAYVTAHILKALLTLATGREMAAWTKEPRLLPTIPIGKQRGAKWPDVDGGFLEWMLRQPDMEVDLKWNAQRELDRRKVP